MAGRALRLGADDMWALLDGVDLLAVLRAGLLAGPGADGRVSRLDPDAVTYEDSAGDRCLLPAADLRSLRTAGVAALAARQLLAPGVVTASVVGGNGSAQWHLGVLARYVPDVSHVAVCADVRPHPRVVDQLDLSGIGLCTNATAVEAIFGATLVVAVGHAVEQVVFDRLARGSVLVNAGTRPVGEDVREGVDQVYAGEELRGALTGERRGRRRLDDVLLVEPLPTDVLLDLDAVLARTLHRAALAQGVGVSLSD